MEINDLTPEQMELMLKIMKDPFKFAKAIYILAKMDDLEELIKEHGELTMFELACDVVAKENGGAQIG